MKYPIGTTIYLIHTAERGVVQGFADDMYQVQLSKGYPIPAFEEDLSIYNPIPEINQYTADFLAPEYKAATRAPETRYAARKFGQPRGVYFGIEGIADLNGINQNYRIWVINEMEFPVVIGLKCHFDSETLFNFEYKLSSLSAVACGIVASDDINDHPDLTLTLQRVSTQGLDVARIKTHRLKGKTIVQAPKDHDILEVPAWTVDMFSAKTLTESEEETQGLSDYAKTIKVKPNQPSGGKYMTIRNIKEIAEFKQDIDLHIEALVDHKGKMNNAEILNLQLMHFESYIDKAARMNIPSVFIIHGVGEGVLKSAIASRLKARPDVQKFNNHYHPKYGYGATEVIFG
jgi:Smr domain